MTEPSTKIANPISPPMPQDEKKDSAGAAVEPTAAPTAAPTATAELTILFVGFVLGCLGDNRKASSRDVEHFRLEGSGFQS